MKLFILLFLLAGCASPKLPAELPHYPCKDKAGNYFACSADEWVYQEILRSKR